MRRNLAGLALLLLFAGAAGGAGCSAEGDFVLEGESSGEAGSLARLAGVRTGVVVVVDALSCGLNGRHLSKLNELHATVNVRPVLLTDWPETGKQQAERMFVIPYRTVSYDAYTSNVEDLFRELRRPFVAVFRDSRLVSVFGNVNGDVIMESLSAHLRMLGRG